MDTHKFDAITRLVANAPDRRNMLKLVGAAAVAGTAGFFARSDDAEAARVRVVIKNVLTGDHFNMDVQNIKAANQVCAQVFQTNIILTFTCGNDTLQCDIQQ